MSVCVSVFCPATAQIDTIITDNQPFWFDTQSTWCTVSFIKHGLACSRLPTMSIPSESLRARSQTTNLNKAQHNGAGGVVLVNFPIKICKVKTWDKVPLVLLQLWGQVLLQSQRKPLGPSCCYCSLQIMTREQVRKILEQTIGHGRVGNLRDIQAF